MKYFVNKYIPMSTELPDTILCQLLQHSVDIEFEATYTSPGTSSPVSADTLYHWASANCQNLYSVTRLSSSASKFYFFDSNDQVKFLEHLKSIS